MRERVEDAFKETEDDDDATDVVTEGKPEAAESAVVAVPAFAEEEKAALDRCESRVSTASTGLSLIFDNYQDDGDGEDSNS